MESKGTLDGGNSLAHTERPPNSGETGEQEAGAVLGGRGSTAERGAAGGSGLERLSRGGAAQRRGSLCYLLYFVSLRKSFQDPQGKVFFSFCFLELSHMFNLGARRIRFYRRKTKLGFILKAKLGFILKTKLGFISKAKTIMGSEIEPTPKLPQFESYLYHFLAIGFGAC